MLINSNKYRVLQNFTPNIIPAIKWKKKSNGKWVASDRGDTQDIHEATIKIYNTYAILTSLMTDLNTYQGTLSVAFGVGEEVFGPHIDYSAPIYINVIKYGTLKKTNFSLYELQITIRLLNHTDYYISDDVTTDPDFLPKTLYSIKNVDEGAQIDRDWTIKKIDTSTNVFEYVSHLSENGTCKLKITYFDSGVSVNNLVGKVIKCMLTHVRSETTFFPGHESAFNSGSPWGGIIKPFGPRDVETLRRVRIIDWKLETKQSPTIWEMSITFVEA